jgi:ABC-2 type transport system ATP-binding protein
MQDNSIQIKNLKKTYRNGVEALKGVSLAIQPGSFFALLGPNGAGKSTLINIVSSLVKKSSGSITVAGHDAEKEPGWVKRELGLMPQEVNLGVFERVDHILINQAGYYGIPKAVAIERMDKLLAQLNLTEKKTSLIRNLSGGMKRRVMVARALIHDPNIVILDEPTAGVDIEIRRNMWDFFIRLNREGKTIILTTHYLEEAEQLCDHVAIINHGQVIESSDMPSLLRRLEHEYFILYLDQPLSQPLSCEGCDITQIDNTSLEVRATKNRGIGQIITELSEQGITINSIRNKSNRLESLFLDLTNRNNPSEESINDDTTRKMGEL